MLAPDESGYSFHFLHFHCDHLSYYEVFHFTMPVHSMLVQCPAGSLLSTHKDMSHQISSFSIAMSLKFSALVKDDFRYSEIL